MDSISERTVYQYILFTIFFGILGFSVNYIAYIKKFFKLNANPNRHGIKAKDIGYVFFVYFFLYFFISPVIYKILSVYLNKLVVISITQLIYFLIFSLLLVAYFRFHPRKIKMIWKDQHSRYGHDFLLGMMTWFISFPIITFINQTALLINYFLFGITKSEQFVIKYVKTLLEKPFFLSISIILITVIAPIFEELIFRGFLQTWLKSFLEIKIAIIVSSLCFALFHLDFSKSMENFPVIISLFFFSLYLGFIYEKQRSLLSPIALHITFNSVSIIRIIAYS